jgi:hypothetical protein
MNNAKRTRSNTFAIPAEVPAIPANPKIAAIVPTSKKAMASLNIFFLTPLTLIFNKLAK